MRYFVLNGSENPGNAIARLGGFSIAAHEEREFEGGEHKARPLACVRGEDVFIFHNLAGDQRLSANDKLLRLLFFIATMKQNGAFRVTALVPYLPYSRKDRQTKPQDPVTTRFVAELFEASGTDLLVTLDVHNVSAFQNAFRIPTLHLSAASLFAQDIISRDTQMPLVFFSPDSGGMKRVQLLKEEFSSFCGRDAEIGMLEKRRSAGVVSGDAFAGEVEGAEVIILDDLIVSGGTLARAAKACRERGAARIACYATHRLFGEPMAADLASAPIDELVVTDSIDAGQSPEIASPSKVRTLSVAPLLARAVVQLCSERPSKA